MSTFVYNDGNFEFENKEKLELTFGLFFDGTTNNLYHTQIRKKVEKKGEFADQTASSDDRDIYAKFGHNDSFGNDFTNVARKYMHTDRNEYSIYIEGIGTVGKEVEKKNDDSTGATYGRGITGIIAKVASGCKQLAKEIQKKKDKREEDENSKITQLILTIDAFGFSRGAAAARHFLHNLQKEAYEPSVQTVNTVHNVNPSQAVIKTDYAGNPINDSWLKDGKLPCSGFLGIALLQAGIARELIETMKINVRFLGVYDTVASFDPNSLLIPNFEKHIGQLHLHDLGNPTRAVHYTAADEHRKNFSLTRLNIGKEINFPGVHSDVGGSYNHDPIIKKDSVKQDEYINKAKKAKFIQPHTPTPNTCEYEIVILKEGNIRKNLERFRDELVQEGWFHPEQIKIRYKYIHPIFNKEIRGERILEGKYSFIPLHFMSEEALVYLSEKLKMGKLLEDYALEDEFLEKVKSYIGEHLIKKGETKWELKDPNRTFYNKPFLLTEEEPTASDEISTTPSILLEEVEVTAYVSDSMLKKLRNRYLHWSAKLNTITDTLAHAPAKNRIRNEF